jgi:hypothetical protein
MSKIIMYSGTTTGTTTTGDQYAFFINETGLPTVKNGSQVITFGTSGYALQGSSGTSGVRGTSGVSGTNGVSGTSGQNGAPGDTGSAGNNGTSGVSGTAGINGVDGGGGTAGTSGLSYGSSGTSGAVGATGSSGSSGSTGATGSSGITGSSGSSGASGGSGTSGSNGNSFTWRGPFDITGTTNYALRDVVYYLGSSYICTTAHTSVASFYAPWWSLMSQAGSNGVSGTSGTSSSGGGGGSATINSKNYEIMNVDLTSGTTVNGGFEYLGGMFGITSHWGYDSSRNYEFGATYPINIAVGKTLKDVIFPIEIDAAGSVPYKVVIWKKQPGTFYPGDKIVVDEFNITGATGYAVVEYNVDFLNDGSYQSGDLFFMSIWRFDSAGNKHRYRSCANTYQDVGFMGIFNPTTKDFASGFQHSMTTIFNSDWAGGGVPATYGPGSYGTIYFGGSIPCFWRIA